MCAFACQELRTVTVTRVEVTVRFYQPFKGCFPVRTIRFDDVCHESVSCADVLMCFIQQETYHPLYIGNWQQQSLLKPADGGVVDPLFSLVTCVQVATRLALSLNLMQSGARWRWGIHSVYDG